MAQENTTQANTAVPTTEEKQFSEEVVSIDRVARVVKGGRRFRFRALVVVGDGKGSVGVGTAKGSDVQKSVTKAVDSAKKQMVKIARSNDTIPHDAQAKVSGAEILLKPAAPGTGVIAGGVARTVIEAAGINDILSKSLGSSNKVNLAYATIEALKQLSPREDWVVPKGTSVKKTSKKEKK